ncbi:hypothetical protein HMPREF9213_1042 [Lactobacillus iners LactinV 09V1-c]|uniref:Uncharacterized protein n=1 Tax=Lactobacillus iners LactinV 01V1-a TaxID=879297 RepID=E1NTC0_9LACO|nr:hypothetical protein HMPREF9213_1042 [Lactobacillus iners LactinV 09V1-c]EFO69150.1 hypothetical protein HMPREF9212_0008 [Lactobacillus iners LactinV 03V1-b]EFO70614.1 hypothetical protein HMPREF9211_1531 [Lactobacillus iners LactinV 01V1-a]EFO71838.1 hypothetical protein HMPREF9215_0165 [Lactobacillus iners SPIN 2503V10-D]
MLLNFDRSIKNTLLSATFIGTVDNNIKMKFGFLVKVSV